jgi:hypothetical protein
MSPVGQKRRKHKQPKSNGKVAQVIPVPAPAPEQVADKPNGETRKYSLNQQELAAYSMVSLRMDLAKEKAANARHLQEAAATLQQQWATGVYRRLSIPETARSTIDTEAGTITVQAVPEPQPPPPTPQLDALPAPQEETAP